MIHQNKFVGGILLVTGTIVGAACLAFPVSTGMAGFFPSCLLFILYWGYMTYTAFLMLEANLWSGRAANLISMAKHTLGRGGEIVSWITYLFLLYALMTAYIALGGDLIIDLVDYAFGLQLPKWAGSIPLIIIFGFFVYEGTSSVDLVNRVFMTGLAITYCLMAFFLFPHVESSNIMRAEWEYLPMAIAVVSTSFGFQIIIPTLSNYLHRDVRKLCLVILIGSCTALFVYIIWEFLTLGIIPIEGEFGIAAGYARGDNGARLLSGVLNKPLISMIARGFSFCALITSLLGVSISLLDFLADGLKIKRNPLGRFILFMLTFIPPAFIVMTDPRAFLSALDYAGAFGVVILLGLIPCLMVYAGRYYHGYEGEFRTPGGKPALIAAIGFSILIIAFEVSVKADWITPLIKGTS